MDLTNLKVLVTGGGGEGVGKGVCEALANFGAQLVVNDIDPQKVEAAVKLYPGAIGITADISKEVEIKQMFDTIQQKIGGVNALVNNAGIGLSRRIHEATTEEFDRLYGVDIRAVWMLSKYFVQQLLPRKEAGGNC